MTDNELKLIQIQSSIGKLKISGMNIPEILVDNSSPITEQARINNVVLVKAVAERVKVSIVIPGVNGYSYLKTSEFWDSIKDYGGEAIIIFRAPKSFPLLTGTCEPTPYYNKITVGNDNKTISVLWGDSILKDFPVILKRPIQDLNGILQRGRDFLDGMSIRFTFHPQGEGRHSDRIVLWGQNYV